MPHKTKPGSWLKSSWLFHLGALIAMTAWGASFVFTHDLVTPPDIVDGVNRGGFGMGPVEVYVYRILLAYLMLLVFEHKQFISHSWRDELLFMVIGMCGGSIYFIAENTAVKYSLPSNVSLITTLSPILTTILVGFIYKNEKPSMWIYLGSLIAFAGVACIIFKDGFSMEVKPIGDLLALGAAFSWAIYSIVLRKLNATYTAGYITRKTFFYGLLTAIPFLSLEPHLTPLSTLIKPAVWINLAFLGIFASVIAYLIWAQVIARLGAVKGSNYLYLQPIATMVISAIMVPGDNITLIGCIGCALIIGGVWFGDYLTMHSKKPA